MGKISKRILTAVIALVIALQPAAEYGSRAEHAKAALVIYDNIISDVYTDKALYNPGDTIKVNVELKNSSASEIKSGTVKLKGMQLNHKSGEEVYESYDVKSGENKIVSLTWTAPDKDYQGYLLEVYVYDGNGVLLDTEAVGVNVSSNWTKFPIYGYLHEFGENVNTEEKISEMVKYHINGIEYYDWHYRHHEPLPSWSTSENPGTWDDWAGRKIDGRTIKDYISKAKQRNMVSMAYDMIYAGTDDFFKENPEAEYWKIKYRYGENAGQEFKFTMGDSPSGNGHLYFVNPLHTDWQKHLFGEVNRMIEEMGFDGYHGDTVGDWGDMTDYYGNPIGWDENGNGIYSVLDTYYPFLNACKANLPEGKYLSFNPVGAKGIQGVNKSNTDVLYTEFWPWDSNRHGNTYAAYNSIVTEIEDSMNDSREASFDGEGKSLTVKAYINYKCSDGYVNDPTVLLFEAVSFAAGGSRLELGNGDHMLTDEYYVNDKVPMSGELKPHVRNMYDFAVAYENLLRDGQATTSNKVSVDGYASSRDGASDTIWTYTRSGGDYEILHLLNLLGTDNEWRDVDRTKAEPEKAADISVKYYYSSDVNSVYLASPDIDDCRSRSLAFTKGEDSDGRYVEFTVPSLEYWDMIYMSDKPADMELSPENPDIVRDVCRIEAEDFTGCSESGTVSGENLYVSGLQNNTITYILPENFRAGQYEIKARYISAVSGELNISAGSKDVNMVWKTNSGGWSWDTAYDMDCGEFMLAPGDTISVGASGDTPYIQIDYFVMVRTGGYECVNPVGSFTLEAEEGQLTPLEGAPAVSEAPAASNGQYVHDIGLNQGYLTLTAPKDIASGMYTLTLKYSSSTNGTVSVIVGDSDEYQADYMLTNYNWDFVSNTVSIPGVKLSAYDTIKIQDARGDCWLWLDCISAELETDNSEVLERAGWTAQSSDTGSGFSVESMFDNDKTTYWQADASLRVSGADSASQVPGQQIIIDTGSPVIFDMIEMLLGPNAECAPAGYEIYVSLDGENYGEPVVRDTDETEQYYIGVQCARYIKIVQTGNKDSAWAVNEFNLKYSDRDNYYIAYINGDTVSGMDAFTQGRLPGELSAALTEDGRVFAGWYTESVKLDSAAAVSAASSKAVELSEVSGNTAVYAGWIEIGTGSTSFELLGTQIRIGDEMGLRFVTQIGKELIKQIEALNNENVLRPDSLLDKGIGYGTVVTKASIVSGSELVKDVNASTVTEGMTVVPAVKYFRKENDYYQYTCVVKGIGVSNYETEIAARPYITYKDANGRELTYYYTEAASSAGGGYKVSLYKAAKAICENSAADSATKDWIRKNIISAVENKQ